MDSQQQFCLKWNSFGSNLATAFSNLFKSESLADVTLFCEGKKTLYTQNMCTIVVPVKMLFSVHPRESYNANHRIKIRYILTNLL